MIERPGRSHRTRLIRLGVLVVLTGLAGVFVFVLANHHPSTYSFFPKCQLHSLTGLHCPGCGLTRSVHCLLNGEFTQALAYNALWPLVLPIIGISLVRSLWSWAWGSSVDLSKPPARLFPRWTPYVLMVVLVTFAIARNLPYHPFTLLAPHELK